MSKLAVYIGILSVTLLAANLLGLIDNTGTSALISWMSHPSALFQTTFYTDLINLLSLIAAAGVIVGFLVSAKTDFAIFAGVVPMLLLIGFDMVTIYQNIALINADFALLFFSPFLAIYVLTVMEWWRAVT